MLSVEVSSSMNRRNPQSSVGGHFTTALPAKATQRDAVALQLLDAVCDHQFRALQAVRREVIGQHALRDIEQEHHVPALTLHALRSWVPSGAAQCERHARQAQQDQRGLQQAAGGTHRELDSIQQTRGDEALDRLASLEGRVNVHDDEQRNHPQQIQEVGFLEDDTAHGILLNAVLFSNVSPVASSRAASASGGNHSR